MFLLCLRWKSSLCKMYDEFLFYKLFSRWSVLYVPIVMIWNRKWKKKRKVVWLFISFVQYWRSNKTTGYNYHSFFFVSMKEKLRHFLANSWIVTDKFFIGFMKRKLKGCCYKSDKRNRNIIWKEHLWPVKVDLFS